MQTGKHFKLMFTFLSAGCVLLGLSLLLLPDLVSKVLVYVLAGLALVLGLMRVAFYFTKDDVAQASRSDLASGVVLLVLGVYLFTCPEGLLALLPILLGFAITYDSVLKISMCFDLRRVSFKAWWVLLLLSAVALAAGILLIISPFNQRIAQIYFACVLVGNGAISLIVLLFTLLFNKRLKALVAPEEAENRRKKHNGDSDDSDDSQEPEAPQPEELPKSDEAVPVPSPGIAPPAPPVAAAEIPPPEAGEKEQPLTVLNPLINEEDK
jgi:uncharacterized membrane protein HdeD (DUF308 family)